MLCCMHMYVYAHLCAGMHDYGCSCVQRLYVDIKCHSYSVSTLVSESGSLTEPDLTNLARLVGR